MRPLVDVALQPSHPVLAFEDEKPLQVWRAVLAHLVLHNEVFYMLPLLIILPELVLISIVVDRKAPPRCRRYR